VSKLKNEKRAGRKTMTINNYHTVRKISSVKNARSKNKDEALVQQFRKLLKNYNNLIQDLVKEMGLLKGWIEKQTFKKRHLVADKLKTRNRKT